MPELYVVTAGDGQQVIQFHVVKLDIGVDAHMRLGEEIGMAIRHDLAGFKKNPV